MPHVWSRRLCCLKLEGIATKASRVICGNSTWLATHHWISWISSCWIGIITSQHPFPTSSNSFRCHSGDKSYLGLFENSVTMCNPKKNWCLRKHGNGNGHAWIHVIHVTLKPSSNKRSIHVCYSCRGSHIAMWYPCPILHPGQPGHIEKPGAWNWSLLMPRTNSTHVTVPESSSSWVGQDGQCWRSWWICGLWGEFTCFIV